MIGNKKYYIDEYESLLDLIFADLSQCMNFVAIQRYTFQTNMRKHIHPNIQRKNEPDLYLYCIVLHKTTRRQINVIDLEAA